MSADDSTLLAAKAFPALPGSQVRWVCDASELGFESTRDVSPISGFVGQDAAIEALRFGLRTRAPGQNVFVRGLSGPSRLRLVRQLLEAENLPCPVVSDRLYVRNFVAPDRPSLLTLPHGKGQSFRKSMADVVRFLTDELPAALESQVARAGRAKVEAKFAAAMAALTTPFDAELREQGLAVVTVQQGQAVRPAIAPVVEGQPVPPEKLEELRAAGSLTAEQIAEIGAQVQAFSARLEDLGRELSAVRAEQSAEILALHRTRIEQLLQGRLAVVRDEFGGADVSAYLNALLEDAVDRFSGDQEALSDIAERYGVHLLLDGRRVQGCTHVIEELPTFERLVGSVQVPAEVESAAGAHTWIRAGAILQSDGG